MIRTLDDEIVSLGEFLEDEHRAEADVEYAFAYTCCYVRHRGRHVLIDGGYDPDTVAGALEAMDVQPEDIEIVLLTHADRDHVAGLLLPDGSPTYPRARHVIGKDAWDHLSQAETLAALDRDRGAFYRKLLRTFENRIRLIEGESVVADGIRFLPTPGHRSGHGVYEFATADSPLIHSGDAFFHSVFVEHPDWPNVTDSFLEQASQSRAWLVEHIAQSGALVLSTHMPFPGMGQIAKLDRATFQWEPVACRSDDSQPAV